VEQLEAELDDEDRQKHVVEHVHQEACARVCARGRAGVAVCARVSCVYLRACVAYRTASRTRCSFAARPSAALRESV
jgi:hypothetical protein